MPFWHANAYLRFLVSFPRELRQHPVDIFHALFSVPLVTPCKVVLSLVEFGWFTNPGDFPASRIFLEQLKMMTRFSIRRADRIITATELVRQQLLEYFQSPPEKVEVVHHGFNEFFLGECDRADIECVKQKYRIPGEYLLSVGDLHPRKNLGRVIKAFGILKEHYRIPHALVLVGKNLWRTQEIYQAAATVSFREEILFTGYVLLEELRALYRGASVLVFPSLDEGFGLPVQEAMASELPVVVSNRGALPEVAGNAALIVDPLDVEAISAAIWQILSNPSLAGQLIHRGKEQIKSFTWEAACRKLLHIYHELVPDISRNDPS